MRKILSVLIFIVFSNLLLAQTTAIPDPKFEQALIDLKYDKVLDGTVLTVNISEVTKLIINGKDISDLTGIEDFVALKFLRVNNNKLVDIDLKQNTALIHLECTNNKLTKLDLTQNKFLIALGCGNNELKSLETHASMKTIGCNNNKLTNLNVSKSTSLIGMWCINNNLTDLDLSKNIGLETLGCNNNQLISLDLTHNIGLKNLDCKNNQLTSIGLTQNKILRKLNCENNQLTSLDLTQNKVLRTLNCANNLLTSLDLTQNEDLDRDSKMFSQADLIDEDGYAISATLILNKSKKIDYKAGLPDDLKDAELVYVNIPYANAINGVFKKRMKKYPYRYKITDDVNDVSGSKYRVFLKREADKKVQVETRKGIVASLADYRSPYSERSLTIYSLYLKNKETGEYYKYNDGTFSLLFKLFVKTVVKDGKGK